jgi:hypothetical protein
LKDEYAELVLRILRGNPIEVFDEDSNSVWQSTLWELSVPRDSGAYANTRKIGSANLITAYNLLALKLCTSDLDTLKTFRKCLELLEQQNYIRRNPENIRKTFKVV